MALLTLPRPTLSSPAARRMEAAGLMFQRRALAAERDAEFARRKAWEEALQRAAEQRRKNRLADLALAMAVAATQGPPPVPQYPSIAAIKQAVCREFQVTFLTMVSQRRAHSEVRPRQVAMWLAKNLTPRSLPDIGRHFGGRDHTTVIHAVRRIDQMCADDPAFAARVEAIRQSLMPGSAQE